MPSKLAPVPQRVPERRRKHKLPLSAQEAESHDRELKEAAVKLVKYRAVMAYYRKEIALEATSTISGGLLTTDTIQTIINDIAARNLKEDPHKYRQVSRYVRNLFQVSSLRELYTDHEYRQAIFACACASTVPGHMKQLEAAETYGVEPRTIRSGLKNLRKSLRADNLKFLPISRLREACDQIDAPHSGPQSALKPAESALIVHTWHARGEIGDGLSKTAQVQNLKDIMADMATGYQDRFMQTGDENDQKLANRLGSLFCPFFS